MDSNGLIKIDEIIADIQVETNDYSEGNVMRYARLVERGVTLMHLFNLNSVSVEKLEVDEASNTAPLPQDYLGHKKIGAILPNGRVYPLTVDQDMSLLNEKECGTEVSYDGVNIQDYSVYSSRGGFSEEGTYHIDSKNHRILLYNVTADTLIIEYVSSGLKIDGETYIPAIAREALVSFVLWKASKTGTAQRDRAFMEFTFEQKKLRTLMMPTLDEVVDSLLQGRSLVNY